MLSIDNEELVDLAKMLKLSAKDDEVTIKLALLKASRNTYQIDAQVMKVGEVSC
jgi:hypothetical protein